MDNYRELHIIMPVKDSIETVREALNCLYTSSDLNWQFTLYNDYSTPENTEALRQLAGHYEFELVNWAERTKHPSPNYRFTLIDAQRKALQEQADLLIIESDVLIRRDTIVRIPWWSFAEYLIDPAEDMEEALQEYIKSLPHKKLNEKQSA